jgi:hypothetical protein
MKSHAVGIQLGGILGFIGLFVMGANTWLGIGMILAAAAIIALSILTPNVPGMDKVERRSPQRKPSRVTHATERTEPVNPKSLSLLKRTLYQANLDPRAAVLTDNNKTILTVQDVLVKMIPIADAERLPIPELAKDITKIYGRIFDSTEQGLRQYPGDTDRLASWLANRALKDVRKELETNTPA